MWEVLKKFLPFKSNLPLLNALSEEKTEEEHWKRMRNETVGLEKAKGRRKKSILYSLDIYCCAVELLLH